MHFITVNYGVQLFVSFSLYSMPGSVPQTSETKGQWLICYTTNTSSCGLFPLKKDAGFAMTAEKIDCTMFIKK